MIEEETFFSVLGLGLCKRNSFLPDDPALPQSVSRRSGQEDCEHRRASAVSSFASRNSSSHLLRRLPARARRVIAGGFTVAMVLTIEVILSDIEAGLEHVFCFASFCVSDV